LNTAEGSKETPHLTWRFPVSFSLAQITGSRRRPAVSAPVPVVVEDADLFALALAVGVLTMRTTPAVRAA
jgi:hypothetical protein